MQEIYFIQGYYYYLLFFLLATVGTSFFSYFDKKQINNLQFFILICFSLFTVFYIGDRDNEIGVDTYNYSRAFELYRKSDTFFIKKDFFFDFFTYCVSKIFDFNFFLKICAFLYVFGAFIGLKKIFKENFYLPFLLFIVSPYFFQFGINVMRNGIAASLLMIVIAYYYNGEKRWKIITVTILSLGFHISMIIPILMFFIAKYLKKIELILLIWLGAIGISLLKINIMAPIANLMLDFSDRVGSYAESSDESSSWGNFLVFGAFPVLFAVYMIVYKKFRNVFYLELTKTYMLTHTIYIVLINTTYALRFGYLAEFMMSILLFFPLIDNSGLKISFVRFKLSLFILVVFLVKGYKILVV
ncbi:MULTISPECIES: EpsG family protein [unclassified Sphingobacterium]|uniref:EpsG family protein n=1 Tax=unclassified Sphingobacterium TaxID=2609468 RepID=UPI0025D35960|nr:MULTISPECIES: EpsG family protein [unclassified Sphingobacterium]